MQSKQDYEYMRVQLDSMRVCLELDAKHAMMDNDIDAYYTLNPLSQEISTCIRRVDALIKLLDERAKIKPGDDGNGGV
jgi:hypothetical protein|uniref:Uncharacterized protein n=1 Tax=Podoviridae sp. ctnuR9 TaxID=2825276 RepID=A0A8S5UG39_9CAUD|nr:MAG TPA: hypothetical protein [Podoviridae sp. ctnuR9]